MVYADLLRLVRNCENLELDFDILITSKLAKYLHLAYVLLLEINDTNSLGYRSLLPRLSSVRKYCKEQILEIVKEKKLTLVQHKEYPVKPAALAVREQVERQCGVDD